MEGGVALQYKIAFALLFVLRGWTENQQMSFFCKGQVALYTKAIDGILDGRDAKIVASLKLPMALERERSTRQFRPVISSKIACGESNQPTAPRSSLWEPYKVLLGILTWPMSTPAYADMLSLCWAFVRFWWGKRREDAIKTILMWALYDSMCHCVCWQ